MEEIQRLARLARERAFQPPLLEREEEEEVEEEGNASVGSCASPDPDACLDDDPESFYKRSPLTKKPRGNAPHAIRDDRWAAVKSASKTAQVDSTLSPVRRRSAGGEPSREAPLSPPLALSDDDEVGPTKEGKSNAAGWPHGGDSEDDSEDDAVPESVAVRDMSGVSESSNIDMRRGSVGDRSEDGDASSSSIRFVKPGYAGASSFVGDADSLDSSVVPGRSPGSDADDSSVMVTRTADLRGGLKKKVFDLTLDPLAWSNICNMGNSSEEKQKDDALSPASIDACIRHLCRCHARARVTSCVRRAGLTGDQILLARKDTLQKARITGQRTQHVTALLRGQIANAVARHDKEFRPMRKGRGGMIFRVGTVEVCKQAFMEVRYRVPCLHLRIAFARRFTASAQV